MMCFKADPNAKTSVNCVSLFVCVWQLLLLPVEKLEGALKERRNKYRVKSVLLTSARFKIDDAIMLFHDF